MLESELIKEILKLGNGPHLFMSVLRKRLRRPSFYLSGIRFREMSSLSTSPTIRRSTSWKGT
jgi:hypothetical protein